MPPNKEGKYMKTNRILNGEQKHLEEPHTGVPAKLLSGVRALKQHDYGSPNPHDSRNNRLLHAVLCAYAKHVLDSPDIGWEELVEILDNTIWHELGDKAFRKWVARIDADTQANLSWD